MEYNTFEEQENFCRNKLSLEMDMTYLGEDVFPKSNTKCIKWDIEIYNLKKPKNNSMHLDFYTGLGYIGDQPEPFSVLSSIYFDNPNGASFEEWCNEFGYDSDSRKAEKVYNACIEKTNKFNELFPNFKWPKEIIEEW